MTGAAARTAQFPAIDPELPPRSRRSRALRAGLVLLVVIVGVGGVRWALAMTGSSSSPVQSAHILAYSHVSASLSITSLGRGTTTSYATIGPVDGGLLATPDGQTLISSSGRTVTLKAGVPVATGTRYFAALTNGGLVDDLADGGSYLAVSTGAGADGLVSLVSAASAEAHSLGTGDTVAGDPTRPALYVAVTGGDALPVGDGFYVSPDRSVEHRGIGVATTVLTTAAEVIGQLRWPTGAPITLDPVPDPTGTLVAVVASPFVTPAAAAASSVPDAASAPGQAVTAPPEGVAVYTTDGALVGVRPAIAARSVTWSPDGRTLLYADTTPGRVVAWTPRTDASTDITLPAGTSALGRCAWSPDRAHAVCAAIASGPNAAIAAWCLLDLRAGTVRSFPRSSEPVLWETG